MKRGPNEFPIESLENDAMTDAEAVSLGREFFYHAVLLTTPALVVSLVIGLIISIFQAVTNIQEQTLSFAPRILALAGLFVITMPWLLQMSIYFTVQMFARAAQAGH
jgi:flagellar biosynthetic protein FliQ